MKKIFLPLICIALLLCAFTLNSCTTVPSDSNLDYLPLDTDSDTNNNVQNDPLANITGNNVFVVTYEDKGNGTITATVSVAGTVAYAGFIGELKYDSNVLTVASNTVSNGVVVGNTVPGKVSFSYGSVSDITTAGSIFTVDFTYSGNVNTSLELEVSEVANASLQDVEFSVRNANVVTK